MAAPTIELSIYMTGLMLLAKRERSREEGGEEELQALLPDAREPGTIKGTDGSDRHIPVVQFRWQDLVNSDRRPFQKFDDLAQESQGLWVLDKDVVEIEGSVSANGAFKTANGSVSDLPDETNQGSTGWIASGTTALRSGLLAPFSPGDGEPLAGVLRLPPQGHLRTAAFSSQQGQYILFELAGQNRPRAVASVVEYRATIPGNSVRLKATKFDDSDGETLELRPTRETDSGEPRIEIWLLNREWDAIRRQIPSRPVREDQPNPEYLFLTQLLEEASDPPQPSFIARGFRKPNGVQPNPFPCDDPVMRWLYFPKPGGQNARGGTCSPMTPG